MFTFSFKKTLFILLFSVCSLSLITAVITLPDPVINLPRLVDNQLVTTGVQQPLTAIMFNYRSYDTLLATALLFLILLGMWAIHFSDNQLPEMRSNTEIALLYPFFPIIILTAGYLLWIDNPLQAAAVLSCVGIGLRLNGHVHPAAEATLGLRVALGGGLAVLTGVAIGSLVLGYATDSANLWIFAIESSLTVSISLILVMLFVATPGFTMRIKS